VQITEVATFRAAMLTTATTGEDKVDEKISSEGESGRLLS